MSTNIPQLARQKHQWVINVLARSGSYAGEPSPGTYCFHLKGRLRDILGKQTAVFTFYKRLVQGDTELAAPGSWFHDQLLRYSEEWGRTAHLYLSPKGVIDRNGILAKHGLPPIRELKENRYQVLLRYSFRTVFYTAPLVQELITFIFDPVRGRCYKRGIDKEFLSEALGAPAADVGAGFLPNSDKAFSTVWGALSQEVDGRAQRLQEKQAVSFERKMRSLKRYYRQLIQEESGERPGRIRNGQEGQEKAQLLKLEWQRRVNEEREQLKPEVRATLVGLAGLHLPMEHWNLGGRRSAWIDPIRGTMLKRAPRKAKAPTY